MSRRIRHEWRWAANRFYTVAESSCARMAQLLYSRIGQQKPRVLTTSDLSTRRAHPLLVHAICLNDPRFQLYRIVDRISAHLILLVIFDSEILIVVCPDYELLRIYHFGPKAQQSWTPEKLQLVSLGLVGLDHKCPGCGVEHFRESHAH